MMRWGNEKKNVILPGGVVTSPSHKSTVNLWPPCSPYPFLHKPFSSMPTSSYLFGVVMFPSKRFSPPKPIPLWWRGWKERERKRDDFTLCRYPRARARKGSSFSLSLSFPPSMLTPPLRKSHSGCSSNSGLVREVLERGSVNGWLSVWPARLNKTSTNLSVGDRRSLEIFRGPPNIPFLLN